MIVFIVFNFKSIPKVIAPVKAHQLNTGDGVEEVGKGGDWVGERFSLELAGALINPSLRNEAISLLCR